MQVNAQFITLLLIFSSYCESTKDTMNPCQQKHHLVSIFTHLTTKTGTIEAAHIMKCHVLTHLVCPGRDVTFSTLGHHAVHRWP